MKVNVSITLSEDLLDAIGNRSGQFESRSDFIETTIRVCIERMMRSRTPKDLAIINQQADRLNREALDVLAFQVTP